MSRKPPRSSDHRPDSPPPAPGQDGPQTGQKWRAAALAVLLAAGAARCFLPELPFQATALSMISNRAALPENPQAYPADLSELSRMTFAVLLLAAGVLWLVGAARDRRLNLRCGKLAGAVALLGLLSLASALAATHRRAALNGWIEQLAMMLAALLMIQLCSDRRRFLTAAAVLAAVGLALAARAYWQSLVELPDAAADFAAHRAERLRQIGWQAGTPQADLAEARVRDFSARGYFGLANPFGSMMIVLGFAALGLAGGKVKAALTARRAGKDAAPRKPGEIDPAALVAVVAVLAAGATVAAIFLTRSEGAIVSAGVAAAVLVAATVWRDALARHWRKCVATALIAMALGAAGIVAYGLRHDRLPTKTMTFRWYYWTGSMEIVAEHPLFGVGPDNFDDAYLRCRRPAAEEDVQTPHNVFAHALAVYGVPGGTCYLAVLAWLVLLAARPEKGDRLLFQPIRMCRKSSLSPFSILPPLLVVAAVLAGRLLLSGASNAYEILLLHTIAPVIVLAAGLGLWLRTARGQAALPDDGAADAARIALAAGCAAFVLHNFITYSLFLPAPATVFYLAVGTAAGWAGREKEARSLSGANAVSPPASGESEAAKRFLTPFSVIAAVGVVAVVSVFWLPVARKTSHTAGMLTALRDGDLRRALAQADAAVQADPLDPRPAADAANLTAMAAASAGEQREEGIELARRYARQAVRRDTDDPAYRRLLGRLCWAAFAAGNPKVPALIASGDDAWAAGKTAEAARDWRAAANLLPPAPPEFFGVKWFHGSVRRDPCNARLRLAFAENLLNADLPAEAVRQLDEARYLNDALDAESVQRLRPAELKRINMLAARAAALMGRKAAAPMTSEASRAGTEAQR